MRAIVREHARSDNEEMARTLTHRLREVTEEFLAHENRHRPDYLEGISPRRWRRPTTARDKLPEPAPQLPLRAPSRGKNRSCQDFGAFFSSPVLAMKVAYFITPVGVTE